MADGALPARQIEATSLTNTGEFGPENGLADHLGIDYVSVSSPVRRIRQESFRPVRVPREGGLTSGPIKVGHGTMSMTLEVYKVPTGQTWVTLRCNPSRLADPDGWRLVTIVPALQYLSAAWSMIAEFVEPSRRLPSATLSRLDVTRDFNGILLPSRYVRSLADAPSDTRGGIRGYSKAFRDRGDSLYWGNRSGQARLYDKHLETRGRAAHGTLRWEVESRRPWCVAHGIRVVHDITPASVVHLARNIWRRSGMGTPVTSLPQFVKDVMTDPKVSDTEARGLLGWLLAESYGANIAPKGKDTMKKYRDIVSRHGVPTLFQECNHDGWPVHGRLDLDTGEEVLHAAL